MKNFVTLELTIEDARAVLDEISNTWWRQPTTKLIRQLRRQIEHYDQNIVPTISNVDKHQEPMHESEPPRLEVLWEKRDSALLRLAKRLQKIRKRCRKPRPKTHWSVPGQGR